MKHNYIYIARKLLYKNGSNSLITWIPVYLRANVRSILDLHYTNKRINKSKKLKLYNTIEDVVWRRGDIFSSAEGISGQTAYTNALWRFNAVQAILSVWRHRPVCPWWRHSGVIWWRVENSRRWEKKVKRIKWFTWPYNVSLDCYKRIR